MYNNNIHKEKGSAVLPLSASKEVGGITTKPISVYKINDLIYNTQESYKIILCIENNLTFFCVSQKEDNAYIKRVYGRITFYSYENKNKADRRFLRYTIYWHLHSFGLSSNSISAVKLLNGVDLSPDPFLCDISLSQIQRQIVKEGGLILSLEREAGNTLNDLYSATKVVNDFENPKLSEEEIA